MRTMTTGQNPSAATPLTWRRALALWLALVAISLQAVAPVAHATAMRGLLASRSGDVQVICTLDGLRVIDWRRIERSERPDDRPIGFHLPADGPQASFKDSCCCDSVATVPALAPVPPVIVVHAAAARHGPPADAIAPAPRRHADSQPRGPPA